METIRNHLPLICTLIGVAGVFFSMALAARVRRAPDGNDRMREIAARLNAPAPRPRA